MWITDLPFIMLRCLISTIIIETIIAFLIGIREKKDILNVVLVNVVTNPLVVIFPIALEFQSGYNARIALFIILELFAFIFEGIVYWKYLNYKKMNGFWISLILNISSYIIGEVLNYFIYG